MQSELPVSDLRNHAVSRYREMMAEINNLANSIRSYDPDTNLPDLEPLFIDATGFHCRRLESRLYRFAMYVRQPSVKIAPGSVERIKCEVLEELENSKNVLRHRLISLMSPPSTQRAMGTV